MLRWPARLMPAKPPKSDRLPIPFRRVLASRRFAFPSGRNVGGTGTFNPALFPCSNQGTLPLKHDVTIPARDVGRAAPSADVIDEVTSSIPALRAFARSLCRNHHDADDLVQETLLKAIANLSQFEPGTRLKAWLFTIMRNTFYTTARRAQREATGAEDTVGADIPTAPTQEWTLRGKELLAAIERLPAHYRETLVLVTMLGEPYEDAAKALGCTIGTVKSRINRARALVKQELAEI
mgnify:FL=1